MPTYDGTLERAQFLARHFGKDKLHYAVGAVLFELKIPMKGAAFDYIKNAVLISFEDPIMPVVKGLYPTICLMYNPTIGSDQIETTKRSAIKIAWRERDDEVWSFYVQPDRDGEYNKPSNAEVVRAVRGF